MIATRIPYALVLFRLTPIRGSRDQVFFVVVNTAYKKKKEKKGSEVVKT